MAAICLIASLLWLYFANQPLSAYMIVLCSNVGFALMVYNLKNKSLQPLYSFFVSIMILIQSAIIIFTQNEAAELTWMLILLTVFAMGLITAIWYFADKHLVNVWFPISAVLISIFSSGIMMINLGEARYQAQQIASIQPQTMVIEGIYERKGLQIIDFKKYGPYAVDEEMLKNLNKGDTVLVQSSQKEIFSIKRKKR